MANTYDIGDMIRLAATFTSGEVNADPTVITLKIKHPSGSVDTYLYGGGTIEMIRPGTGDYYKDVTLAEQGGWYYRFAGTGTLVAAAENYFDVRDSKFD